MLPALLRPPCFVSFSGGRDSSAVLATAVDVARRHGLAAPIPATMRFPDAPRAEESSWQELVLGHLGIQEHEVIELHDELDALGPIATDILRRNGLRWPGNAYMHVPIFEVASGGSLLTGTGGDELLDTKASRFVLAAWRQVRPRPRDLVSAAFALSPRRLRAGVWRRRRAAPPSGWLTPRGASVVTEALAWEDAGWPNRWEAAVRHWYRSRAFVALRDCLPTVAGQWDVNVVNPFLDTGVLSALARAGGATGFLSRDVAMAHLFGDLLPHALLTRPTKASFGGSVWGPATRAFATGWRGEGVDPRDVDVAALRAEWLRAEPSFVTILLLQAAWLDANGGQAQESAASS